MNEQTLTGKYFIFRFKKKHLINFFNTCNGKQIETITLFKLKNKVNKSSGGRILCFSAIMQEGML